MGQSTRVNGNEDRAVPVDRARRQLEKEGTAVAELLAKIPLSHAGPLPPDWLRTEMLERFQVLRASEALLGPRVVEVGSGPHAIATVPLAFFVGERGWVVAVEPARWDRFREVVGSSGLSARVHPVRGDARSLPFSPDAFTTAVCLHGVRSLGDGRSLVAVFREMLRVARTVIVAESLPEGRTDAQRAHLAMYDLREEAFEAAFGRRDDRRYLPMAQLLRRVEEAGGQIRSSRAVEIDLPHFLAEFPRELLAQIRDPPRRDRLTAAWDHAAELAKQHGADHPPVGIVVASR